MLPRAGIGVDYGLAGTIVMELALRGLLQVDGERVSATDSATDDALLDDALRAIAATPGKTLSLWVRHLPAN